MKPIEDAKRSERLKLILEGLVLNCSYSANSEIPNYLHNERKKAHRYLLAEFRRLISQRKLGGE